MLRHHPFPGKKESTRRHEPHDERHGEHCKKREPKHCKPHHHHHKSRKHCR